MAEDNAITKPYMDGFVQGMTHSRPVVELEHKVNALQSRTKFLSWAGGIAGALFLINFIAKLPILNKFLGRKADEKEFLQWKEERKAKETKVSEADGGKIRLHAREFNTRAIW
jgi:hypothetical protein